MAKNMKNRHSRREEGDKAWRAGNYKAREGRKRKRSTDNYRAEQRLLVLHDVNPLAGLMEHPGHGSHEMEITRDREKEDVCLMSRTTISPFAVLIAMSVGLNGSLVDQELHLLVEGRGHGRRRLPQQDVQWLR